MWALCGLAGVSRAMVCGDFNNDGHLDLVVTHVDQPPKVLQNIAGRHAHWLIVRAVDPRLNRDAYGAELYVQAGSQTLMRWVNPGYSYLSSNDPRAHFGLGDRATYDSIRVIWPDGMDETFPGGSADQHVTLRRGEGQHQRSLRQ